MSEGLLTAADVVPKTTTAPAASSQRLMSLDALRGFDMFWIIGAEGLVAALTKMAHTDAAHGFSILGFIATELEHCAWDGFHFEDLIFPLFVFMSGVSVVFSLGKTIRTEGRSAAVARVFRRSILLFVLALFYSGGFSNNWPDIRLLGVLNRIALCYFFAGLIFCFFEWRGMVAIAVGLLVVYWGLMTFVPIRNIQLSDTALAKVSEQRGVPNDPKALFYATTERISGQYKPGLNLANHLDFEYLPGKKWDKYYDPEGYLSTMPAIVSCLLGVFAGMFLTRGTLSDQQKVICLIAAGLVLVALGLAWSVQFPIVKKIWTSSFVLVAGGCSSFLLGVFYLIVDVWKYQKWCQPFVWMGMNSITIYVVSNILGGWKKISVRFAGGDVHDFLNGKWNGLGDLAVSIIGLALAFWFMHFLYRRRIFLRL